jgi:hypothetical protein
LARGRPYTEDEVRSWAARYNALTPAQRINGSTAGRALGMSQQMFDRMLNQVLPRFGIKVERPHGVPLIASPDDPAADQLRRAHARAAGAEARMRHLQKEIDADQHVREALFGLRDVQLAPPAWPRAIPPRKGRKKVPSTPILFFSDPQWGECVEASEMDGVNEYNPTIAGRRYRKIIDTTVEIAQRHMGGEHDYPGIVYIRGGDMVSGEIHEELRETNSLHSIPAVKDLVEHEIRGIRELLTVFPRVHVVSVPGNHGRTTDKPHAKRFVETNYDTLSAWWLESQFAGDVRVTFQTPASGDAVVHVYGWRFLATHGDRIGSRGGMGFIGPAATIARGVKRTLDYYATLGTVIHWVLMGHFHTRLELERCFVNGCLPGVTEYAKSGRMIPAPAEQWLLFVHPEKGVTARWPILASERPQLRLPSADVF